MTKLPVASHTWCMNTNLQCYNIQLAADFGQTDHHQANIYKLKILAMLKMPKMLLYLCVNSFFMGSSLHDLLLWPIQT